MTTDTDQKIELITTDKDGYRVLNLERLCDIFSRANASVTNEPSLAQIFFSKVETLGQDFSNIMYGNGALTKAMTDNMRRIILLARDNDVDKIILPFHVKSACTDEFNKNVLSGGSMPDFYRVKVEFCDGSYRSHPSIVSLGARDYSRSTILNHGLHRPTFMGV